jgi:hypothetical protein
MFIEIIFNCFIIIIFALVIFLTTIKNDWYTNNPEKNLTFMDSLYLCTTSFSSVGFGDISPKSTKAKIIIIFLQIFILLEILSISQYVGDCLNVSLMHNVIFLWFLIVVCTLYFTFVTKRSDWKFPSVEESNSLLNMFYFTNTTVTTCGYGEIVPVTNASRIPVMCIQALIIFKVLSSLCG